MERATPPRITKLEYNRSASVEIWSDLGASEGNDMAMLFTQRVGRETHIIDCASAPNVGIDWLVEQANKRAVDRKFVYGQVPFVLPRRQPPAAQQRGRDVVCTRS